MLLSTLNQSPDELKVVFAPFMSYQKCMFRLLLFCAVVCFTQTGSVLSQEKVVRLWDGDAPGALGKQEEDTPTLTLYLPERAQASGAGMVICPGEDMGILLSTR